MSSRGGGWTGSFVLLFVVLAGMVVAGWCGRVVTLLVIAWVLGRPLAQSVLCAAEPSKAYLALMLNGDASGLDPQASCIEMVGSSPTSRPICCWRRSRR